MSAIFEEGRVSELTGRALAAAASLEDFFENGALGLHIVGADGTILRANKAELALLGYDAEDYVGRHIADFHADPDTIADILARLGRGEVLDKYPARLRTSSGDIKHVQISSSVYFGEAGDFLSTRCFTVDITQQIEAEKALRQAQQRLEINDERLQMALAASGMVGLWDWMVDSDLLHGDANFARLYGLDVGKTAAGLTMAEYQTHVVAEDLPDLAAKTAAVFERRADFLVEYRLAIPGQPLRWIECKGRMIGGQDDQPLRFSGTAIDITGRKVIEDQKHLLMEELSHRVKNTFASIQAIAVQTLRSAGPDLETFQSRLLALSRAHDVLLQRGWTPSSIGSLVEKVLRLDVEGARFEIDGPDLTINANAALSLSLLLHEMTTNAVKYGALSVDSGKVEVRWSVGAGLFELDWTERGGPPATAPHTKGFGSRLIAMGIAGSRMTQLDYSAEGLRARFQGPLASLVDTPAENP
jgi:PAS domain S-box-containing protein